MPSGSGTYYYLPSASPKLGPAGDGLVRELRVVGGSSGARPESRDCSDKIRWLEGGQPVAALIGSSRPPSSQGPSSNADVRAEM